MVLRHVVLLKSSFGAEILVAEFTVIHVNGKIMLLQGVLAAKSLATRVTYPVIHCDDLSKLLLGIH